MTFWVASVVFSESISNVQVQSMNSAVERQPYNLTCGATGPVDSIHWMKDSKPLQAGSRIVFLQNNKTVSFMPAERSDTGNYQCMACNQAENVTSVPYNLIVNCKFILDICCHVSQLFVEHFRFYWC